ncbi:MAG: DNA translocase FtsK 4TM domain-containing protein [Chitinophagales bacterium]
MKKKKPDIKEKPKGRIEVNAALIMAVAVFLLIGFLCYSGKVVDQRTIGIIGSQVVRAMKILFGPSAFLVPILMAIWALHMFKNHTYWSTRMYGVVAFYLAILVYWSFHKISPGLDVWESARFGNVMGGGYIGAAITTALIKLMGRLGAQLLIILSLLVGFVLIVDKPLPELINLIKTRFNDLTGFINQLVFYEEEISTEPKIVDNTHRQVKKEADPVSSEPVPSEPLIEEVPKRQVKVQRRFDSFNGYHPPGLELLNLSDSDRGFSKSDIKESIKTLEDTFNNFGIKIKVNQVSCGPTVTRYELQPAPGVKVSKILSLTDDLQLSLAASAIRIEAPIPGKSAVGIEVPNDKIARVGLRTILASSLFQDSTHPLTVALGLDISGSPVITNLADMPHLLIAGATGSGKSVCLNSLIISLLYKSSPEELRLVLIDPKMVELTAFNHIPHILTPVVTDAKKASLVLRWMNTEMEKRYQRFSQEGVRDIYRYNEVSSDRLPFIVIIIDELADLMMVSPVEVEDSICRLAQMARAAGIHLVVATQRPSVDVVTGIIKANIPSRVAFAVSSQSDSRTIIDTGGAEKLLGRGDMLFFPVGSAKPLRVQGAYISDAELERVVEFLKLNNNPSPFENREWETSFVDASEADYEDELFWDAVRVVVESQKASVSLLQRKLRIGYSRAARLVDIMEDRGIVSEPDNNRKREILIDEEQLKKLSSRTVI